MYEVQGPHAYKTMNQVELVASTDSLTSFMVVLLFPSEIFRGLTSRELAGFVDPL